jgi:hypothetical protein
LADTVVTPDVQTTDPMDMLTKLKSVDHDIQELGKSYLKSGLEKSDYENKLLTMKKRHKEILSKLQELLTSNPDMSRDLRFRLYANRTVQLLLTGFIGGMVKDLEPNLDADRKARYPILENIDESAAGMNPSQTLDELLYAGVLGRKLYERFVCCPKCGSHSTVFLRLECPECGSLELDSSKLIEHLVCGSVHEFEEFATDDKLVCPSCKEPLLQEGDDYRIVGTFNRCESCRVHFDEPNKRFACRACREKFELKDATYYDTYTYSLNSNLLTEVKGFVGLPIFKGSLEEAGFKVDLPGSITGSSGMIHNFTLVASKNGTAVAVDVIEAETEVEEKELFAFYTKIKDLGSTTGIFVAVPHLSKRAEGFATKLFAGGEMSFVEGNTVTEAAELFKVKIKGIS